MLLNGASFHGGCCRHKVLLSSLRPLLSNSKLYSSYRRPGAEPEKKLSWQNADFSFKRSIDHLKTQLSLLKKETQDYLKGPGGNPLNQHLLEQTRVLWQFRSQEDLNKWVISSDVEIGGKSKVYIKLGRNNQAALLYGTLNTEVPRDGETKYSGYCSMRSRPEVVSTAPCLHSFSYQIWGRLWNPSDSKWLALSCWSLSGALHFLSDMSLPLCCFDQEGT